MAGTASTMGKFFRRFYFLSWKAFGRKNVTTEKTFSAVVMKLDLVGDFVLAVSAIRLITKKFGESHCALVVSPAVEELAKHEFPEATIITLPSFILQRNAFPGWLKARATLSGLSCDHLICLRHQRWDYHELTLGWIKSRQLHVLRPEDQAKAGVSDFGEVVSTTELQLCGELELHRKILVNVLGRVPTKEEIIPALSVPPGRPTEHYGLIAPFSNNSLKDLPLGLVKEALATDNAWQQTAIVLTGMLKDLDRLNIWKAAIENISDKNVEVRATENLINFIKTVSGAKWVFSADSAAAHIAISYDLPTLILLGGGHYGQFGPWHKSTKQFWLSKKLPCYFCSWVCRYAEPVCITEISAVEVVRNLTKISVPRGNLDAAFKTD